MLQLPLAMLLLCGLQQALAQSTPPAPQSPAPGAPTSAPAQNPQKAEPAKKPTTADDNPFPEDISRKAAAPSGAAPSDKPPTSDSSGNDAPGKTPDFPAPAESSSRSKFAGMGDLSDGGDRISNGAGGYIVNPRLAADDVKVGGLYLDQHDYKGAYLRYKEATRVDPENADAVFGLAEAARGLKKNDEAVQNYLVYLDAFPDGKKAREARKAIAALGGAPKK